MSRFAATSVCSSGRQTHGMAILLCCAAFAIADASGARTPGPDDAFAAQRPEDVDFLDVEAALATGAWKHGPSNSWWIAISEGRDERGRLALRTTVRPDAFDGEFKSESLDLPRDATPLSVRFPGLGRGKSLRLHARALGGKPAKVEFAAVLPGGYAWGKTIELAPVWGDVEIPIGKLAYFSQWGLAKPEGMELDLGRVSSIHFCLGRWLVGKGETPPEGFEVSSVRPVFDRGDCAQAMPWRLDRDLALVGMRGSPTTNGTGKVLRADGFSPFVDKFGQFRHDEWTGKIHSDEELQNDARREADWLATVPPPRRDLDQYGGWAAGPKLRGTGFFRVEKVDGKWWLVDPEGRLFFSQGMTCVGMPDRTGVTGRERYFESLPPRDDALFGACYATNFNAASHGHYSKPGNFPYETYSFAEANRMLKYGPDWKRRCAELAHARLRVWGFNTLGNWSTWSVASLRRTPYVVYVDTAGAPRLAGSKGWWGALPDPFDPKFETILRRRLGHWSQRMKDDPWCIGVFVDNELSWNDEPSMRRIAAKYFDVVSRAVREAMPNHLYLGCRIAWGAPCVYEEAAKRCDVISVNAYERRFDPVLPASVDRPVLCGEFHFGTFGRGMFHAGLVPSSGQRERAALYRAYMADCLDDPRCVGAHWFQYQDEPLTGRFDGENYQIGFVDVTDGPYAEMVSASRDVAARLYERRFGEPRQGGKCK